MLYARIDVSVAAGSSRVHHRRHTGLLIGGEGSGATTHRRGDHRDTRGSIHPATPRIRQGLRRNLHVAGPARADGNEGHRHETTNRGAINDRAGLGRRRGGDRRRYGPRPYPVVPVSLGSWPGCPARQPIRPMSVVPRGSPGADGQSSCEPRGLGHECLPHLLVRLLLGRAMSPRNISRERRHLRRLHLRRLASISAQSRPGARDLVGVAG